MTRNKIGILALSLLAFFGTATLVDANVSLRNGNFFIAYRDIYYPGGFEPKVERVYNSKSSYSGMFGYGWGTEYEVYLKVAADGSLVIHEYGGGAQNRFYPVGYKSSQLKRGIKKLVKAAKASGIVTNARGEKRYRKKIKTDAIFRSQQWDNFVASGKLKPKKIANGTKFTSNRFSYQYITKAKGKFIRVFDNGRIEEYNFDGRLIKIRDKNRNFIKLTYSKTGNLIKIVDNQGRKMFLSYDSNGRVIKVEGTQKTAKYKYSKTGDLIYIKDSDKNVYRYTYSTDRYHNLEKITYSDKTTAKIWYYGKDKNQNVKKYKDRDGTVTHYTYKNKKRDKNHFVVSVKIKDKGKKTISTSTYEYIMRTKKTGEQFTYKMITTLDGDRTETVYNECCGLPIKITRGRSITRFKYDGKGRVTEKDTPTELTRLKYHRKVGKVTRVNKYSKLTKTKKWSKFDYDKKGNLIFAKNSKKQEVQLTYDSLGRIKRMRDKRKRVIKFTYNENSKPVRITDPKLGSIKVTYKNSGEVDKLESTAGRKIALQVTSTFQTLLSIIRPAGVSLSF